MAIKVGDIYREQSTGALYEVTQAAPRQVKLLLWDGSGKASLKLEPIDVLSRFQLWRDLKWKRVSREELFERAN